MFTDVEVPFMNIPNDYVMALDIGYSIFVAIEESRFVIQISENVLVFCK